MAEFFQVAPPDLSGLGLGTASFESMQALGFSADSTLLLVKVSFTDDGEPTPFSKYAAFVYDLNDNKYIANLNALLGPEANVTQIKDAYIVGDRTSWEVVANVDILNSTSMTLKSYLSTGEVVSNLLFAEATDLSHLTSSSEIIAERFQLTDDGRYLAVQTSSDLLAADASDDVNQSSDIYLIDREIGSVTRVSFQGGIGKDDAVYLADITQQNSQLMVAFVTDQYFSLNDKNSIDVDLNSPAETRNDLYLASSYLGNDGALSEFQFELLSVDGDGYATGFVDRDSDSLPKITESGVYFSSDSFSLISGDSNEAKDVFVATSTAVQRVNLSGISELIGGADFVGASRSGSTVFVKTSSSEFSGSPGVDQILKISVVDSSYEVVSNNNVQADNIVINGSVSPSGRVLAFTSLASNLVPIDQTLSSDYDLYVSTFDNVNNAPVAASTKFLTTDEDTAVAGSVDASDGDGDTLTYSFSDPTKGSITNNSDGTYIYTPNANVNGSDSFTITVSDGTASITQDVLVTINAEVRSNILVSYWSETSNAEMPAISNQEFVFSSASSTVTATTDFTGMMDTQGLISTNYQAVGRSIDAEGAISISDVIATLKAVVGINELSTYQQLAADVTQDDKVTISDVISVLKIVVGIEEGGTLILTDQGNDEFTITSNTTELTAVALGDVDGSWANTAVADIL